MPRKSIASADPQPPSDPADPRLVSGQVWEAFCDALRRSASRVTGEGVPDTPRDRAEGFRYLSRFLAAGLVQCVTHADPDYPVFGRMIDYSMPWGLDSPDTLYLYAGLRGDAEYRIFGNRGSANHIDIQVNHGHYSQGDIASWGTIDSIDGSALECDAEGDFELRLSAKEPRERTHQIRLADNAEFVLVRQYFDDWETERPAEIAIERLDAAWPIPAPRTDQMAARLDRLSTWLEKGGALWENMSRGLLSMPPNSVLVHMPRDAGERSGMRGQAYGMGNFQCGPDEAVILEFEPPRCRHWSVSLANWWWEAVEYASRQSSLNRHQSRLDSDGRFRAVIAHHDPGVPNWLDTGGNARGTLAVRFLLADRTPPLTLRVVPLEQLRGELPSDTPAVSERERAESLVRRRRAVWRRFRC